MTMDTTVASITDIPAEMYPIVAAHLPLYSAPSSLLALALTNRRISSNALPLVYSYLVLKNETDALHVLQKLLDDPTLGRSVRELHIISDLSHETRIQGPSSDVIRRVTEVILKGYLPFVNALSLHLGPGWYSYKEYKEGYYKTVKGFGQLRVNFWSQVKENCPRLRVLSLRGFEDDQLDPWIEESGVLEASGIAGLSLRMRVHGLASDKLLQNISSLALSLHTLDLDAEFIPVWDIPELDFPCLRSLSLTSFKSQVNTLRAMAFWERHPSIECLAIVPDTTYGNHHWFTPAVPGDLLPNLIHLRVCWSDALLLAPILGQLLSLSIRGSVNAQVPYLLRSICPNALPKLRSLNIGQTRSSWSNVKDKKLESSLWYESEDGTFQRATNRVSRTVFDSYMHSIVRATPNLEEIGFHGSRFPLSDFTQISGDLNQLPHLKHLYYEDVENTHSDLRSFDEKKKAMTHPATKLAEMVPGLRSITNVDTRYPPYPCARITRGENGEVMSVDVGSGSGMKIGNEDKAFP